MLRMMAAKLVDIETGELSTALAAVAAGKASDEDLRIISRVPRYNAQLRTTCVATRIEGGHGDNALPQRAKATVNCRLLPAEDPAFIQAELQRVAGGKVTVTPRSNVRKSDPSDPESPWMKTIARLSAEAWPTATVVPVMGRAPRTDRDSATRAMRFMVSGIYTNWVRIGCTGRTSGWASGASSTPRTTSIARCPGLGNGGKRHRRAAKARAAAPIQRQSTEHEP